MTAVITEATPSVDALLLANRDAFHANAWAKYSNRLTIVFDGDRDEANAELDLQLVQLANKYEPARGKPFLAYAAGRLPNLITDMARKRDGAQINRIDTLRVSFLREHGREPEPDEIGVSAERWRTYRLAKRPLVSMDDPDHPIREPSLSERIEHISVLNRIRNELSKFASSTGRNNPDVLDATQQARDAVTHLATVIEQSDARKKLADRKTELESQLADVNQRLKDLTHKPGKKQSNASAPKVQCPDCFGEFNPRGLGIHRAKAHAKEADRG